MPVIGARPCCLVFRDGGASGWLSLAGLKSATMGDMQAESFS